jgi:hypothetical protein
MPRGEIADRLRQVFTERNRAIRNVDYRKLDPGSVADDYLLPRKDLHHFVVENWIKLIFIPALSERARESILMFGLGRLFSGYNDLGAQHSTDVDFNIIAEDGLSKRDYDSLSSALSRLRADLYDSFGISLELHPDYSLLRESCVAQRLSGGKAADRMACAFFYKANERSIRVIHDKEDLRERVFSRVRHLPDAYLFEHFLGLGGAGTTFAMLRSGAPLTIGPDNPGPSVRVKTVIGSRAYDLYCRRLFPKRLHISPPQWHFSMKYWVNRVYDYVCAMRNSGHTLSRIGLGGKAAEQDYLYLRNAHKLMLHLQELSQSLLDAYSARVDSSYISRDRFTRFVELAGDRFREDFDAMVLEGCLIPPSQGPRYRSLQAKIKARSRDRFMEGPLEGLEDFPPGFRYESTHKDANGYRIYVPYSWADSGYLVFSSIAERIARIVETRLIPALPGLGMPPEAMARYGECIRPSARGAPDQD